MGCEAMLQVLKNEINREINEYSNRRIRKAIDNADRIDNSGLLFVTNDSAKRTMENFLEYVIDNDRFLKECEERQANEIRPESEEDARYLDAHKGLMKLFG